MRFEGWRVVALGLFALGVQVTLLRAGGEGGFLGFPVHHDDFRNLSYTTLGDLPSLSVRPVSTLVLVLLSIAGPSFYYAALLAFVSTYVALVLSVMRRLFPASGWPALLTTGAAVVGALLFERVPEYALYSGLVTNLVSAVAAMGSIVALEARPRSPGGRLAWTTVGVVLFAASVFAKEDFALAVLAFLALRALERYVAGDRQDWPRDAVLLSVLLGICAGFLLWSLAGVRPTFLRASGDTYEAVFTPASLVLTTLKYLTCTTGAKVAATVHLGVFVLVALSGNRLAALRVAGTFVVVLALVAPYAALPNHFYSYYGLNWTVWQAAALVALGPLLADASRPLRRVLAGGIVGLVIAWVAVTEPARSAVVRWYRSEAERSRAVLRTLEGARPDLRSWPVVGVVGVTSLNPWFGNDGEYLRRRLGFENRWIVFAGPDYVESTRGLLGSLEFGSVEVRLEHGFLRADMPIITLAPDGSGTLSLPSPAALGSPGGARFTAQPSQLQVCDGTALGATRLEWAAAVPVEVRVGSLDGPVFAGPAAIGSAVTGKWVNDGATFFLRDPEGRVAGILSVRVTAEGCP